MNMFVRKFCIARRWPWGWTGTDDHPPPARAWDKGNLDLSEAKKPEMLQFEYARSALKTGLKLEQKLGVNPYKFGMIGSTDSHTGARRRPRRTTSSASSAPRSRARIVRTTPSSQTGDRIDHGLGTGRLGLCRRLGDREHPRSDLGRDEAQGGLRHHRAAHDRALLRRLGLRPMPTRRRAAPPIVGYTKGVPMGGDLAAAPAGKAPTFLVAALKDPIGANLDRIQIVKGWLDASGELHEKVYDVAWSGDRKPGADGKLPPVGNTVDVANATWTNTIGAPELIAVWKDPDFDPAQRAFYYVPRASRSRRRAGRPTTRSASASRCRRTCR